MANLVNNVMVAKIETPMKKGTEESKDRQSRCSMRTAQEIIPPSPFYQICSRFAGPQYSQYVVDVRLRWKDANKSNNHIEAVHLDAHMNSTSIRWIGPFSLVPLAKYPTVYDAKDAATSGIYLWALPVDGSYLINYVGIASYSIAARQEEHMRLYLSGKYTIYDPMEFTHGKRVVIYRPQQGISEFLLRQQVLLEALIKNTGSLHLFFAPLAGDKVLLKRIESSIIEALRGADEEVVAFLDNLKISRWWPNEQRISVTIHGAPTFRGLPSELRV